MPLAAAAYNAGPRPRGWRNGPMIEGAAWAENVPFQETREYVKKCCQHHLSMPRSSRPAAVAQGAAWVSARATRPPAPAPDLP